MIFSTFATYFWSLWKIIKYSKNYLKKRKKNILFITSNFIKMDTFETKKFLVYCWLLGKVKSHQRRWMHLISDMLFLNTSLQQFWGQNFKKSNIFVFNGQSVITLLNLVVFILIISMIFCLMDKKVLYLSPWNIFK